MLATFASASRRSGRFGMELVFIFFNYSSESVDRLFARFFQAARLLIFNEANGKEHFACDREPIDNRVISLLSLFLSLAYSLSLSLWLLYNYDSGVTSCLAKYLATNHQSVLSGQSFLLSNSLLISFDFDTFFAGSRCEQPHETSREAAGREWQRVPTGNRAY